MHNAETVQRRQQPDGGLHGRRDAEPIVAAFDHLPEFDDAGPGAHLHPVRHAARRLDQGAVYGDDVQDNTNFPLVRITNSVTGMVTYARTSNWTSVSIAPGTRSWTKFTLPAGTPPGRGTLAVVANGIASPPSTVTIP